MVHYFEFNKRYDIKKYFSKRISKAVIPYIAWSFIAIVVLLFVGDVNIVDINSVYIYLKA